MAEKKGEEWEEYNNAVQWTAVTVLVSLIVSIFLAIFSLPLGYLIGTGVSQESLDIAGRFIKTIFILIIHLNMCIIMMLLIKESL